MHYVFYHIAEFLGLTDINGAWYAFWSGIGSDIGEFALIGVIFRVAGKAKKQHSRHHEALIAKLTEGNDL